MLIEIDTLQKLNMRNGIECNLNVVSNLKRNDISAKTLLSFHYIDFNILIRSSFIVNIPVGGL